MNRLISLVSALRGVLHSRTDAPRNRRGFQPQGEGLDLRVVPSQVAGAAQIVMVTTSAGDPNKGDVKDQIDIESGSTPTPVPATPINDPSHG